MRRVGALTPDRTDPDARIWVAALLEHAEHPIGVTGYCMGARLAVRTAALGAALEAAGLTHTNEVYAGASHGYTMADSAPYDEAATERHFGELRALLDRAL